MQAFNDSAQRLLSSSLQGYYRLTNSEASRTSYKTDVRIKISTPFSASSGPASAPHPHHLTEPSSSTGNNPSPSLSQDHSNHTPHVPWFAYPLLVAAVFAVSSAATVFSLMPDVPALTLAAWRLQLTTGLLGIGAIWQWRQMTPDARTRTMSSVAWLVGSGACLSIHFGAWVWGLQHTSLTHSLLMVSATPLLLAGVAVARGSVLSRGELGGTALGLAGAIVLAAGATGGREAAVGLTGDLASLLASAVMVGYLSVGRRLRSWMPIFVYAFPVTGVAAAGLTLAGLALEPVSLGGVGRQGVFGWAVSGHYGPWVLYLALGPGIVGHTGFNTLLRYLTPLTAALAFQLEPLVGSLMGWAAGVMQPPGTLTYVGGLLLVAATVWVTAASTAREAAEAVAAALSDDAGVADRGGGEGYGKDGGTRVLAMVSREWWSRSREGVEAGGGDGDEQEEEERTGLLRNGGR